MMETIFFSLLETTNKKTANGEETSVYQAMENVVRRAVSRFAANEVILSTVNNFADSEHVVQQLTSNLIKNLSFTV